MCKEHAMLSSFSSTIALIWRRTSEWQRSFKLRRAHSAEMKAGLEEPSDLSMPRCIPPLSTLHLIARLSQCRWDKDSPFAWKRQSGHPRRHSHSCRTDINVSSECWADLALHQGPETAAPFQCPHMQVCSPFLRLLC